MNRKIRWGILSTGGIADSFVRGLRFCPDADVAAVGSRTLEAAERFGARLSIPRRHGSYEALAADPDVDVIYVATPHNLHCENTLLGLAAGKHVLCEKPFALNAGQAERMVAAARARGLFLMEAMWTRFIPAVREMGRLLAEGLIGEPRLLEADLGFVAPPNPEGRLFNPALGGGALLDIGIYPVSMAYRLFGPPDRVESLAVLGRTGVDEQSGALFAYDDGRLAVLHATLTADAMSDVVVTGTRGRIRLHPPIYKPEALSIALRNLPDAAKPKPAAASHRERTLRFPIRGNGMNYEAEEVMRCLRERRLESADLPLDESLAIMRTLDRIRAPWGLRYPGEA
jgi:dihydrodiol dehydrogenase / D-xylose 1-dehydrogenase (NADP)